MLSAGIALACVALEGYLRLKWPFLNREYHRRVHPKAGLTLKPNSQIKSTNPHREFFVVEKVNRLGFLDREPLSPEQTSAGCHMAIIGDSFVEAREVAIADKFHVRLEQLAAQELPDLNITTSAFGTGGTGQINQLPYYDEFARPLKPCVLVLVFVMNDFQDNHPVLQALNRSGFNPDYSPFVSAKNEDGTFYLREPHPDFLMHRLPRLPISWTSRIRIYSTRRSYLASWMHSKFIFSKYRPVMIDHELHTWVKILSRRPRYDSLADEWPLHLAGKSEILLADPNRAFSYLFKEKDMPPVFEEALEFTGYALDQFKARADRDGVSLVILSTYTMGARGDRLFDRMHALAEGRDIPVIDQTDYIRRHHGGRIKDAHWKHDTHWNATGHQWAAEALLEYLKKNPHICRNHSNKVDQGDAPEH